MCTNEENVTQEQTWETLMGGTKNYGINLRSLLNY